MLVWNRQALSRHWGHRCIHPSNPASCLWSQTELQRWCQVVQLLLRRPEWNLPEDITSNKELIWYFKPIDWQWYCFEHNRKLIMQALNQFYCVFFIERTCYTGSTTQICNIHMRYACWNKSLIGRPGRNTMATSLNYKLTYALLLFSAEYCLVFVNVLYFWLFIFTQLLPLLGHFSYIEV